MRPLLHPLAADELGEALDHYQGLSPGLGFDLIDEVERIATLLCHTPNIGEPLTKRHRRFPLRRFPYGIIFRADDDVLTIVAIAHQRQKPNYWSKRK